MTLMHIFIEDSINSNMNIVGVMVMMFNATFNNISIIAWWSVL